MDRYIHWRTEEGAPFDPWLRTHWRLGATILKVAPESMRIVGSVTDWETWTHMKFPESGESIVTAALAPIQIDRERDQGLYIEANVWVKHTLP